MDTATATVLTTAITTLASSGVGTILLTGFILGMAALSYWQVKVLGSRSRTEPQK